MAQHRNHNQGNYRNRSQEEVKVSSPYNFVPLNKHVYFPDWGEQVSHDIPFEDGLSGSFEVEIEAQSPIFIRGTRINQDKYYELDDKGKVSTEFMHLIDKKGQKRYFIPGSSFRNMLRSVVEVLSFGKMKYVYDNKIKDKIKYGILSPISFHQKSVNDKQLDLAEAMFGEVVNINRQENKKYKGRVFVSHAFCISQSFQNIEKQVLILGSPKPTFYPFYLRQNTINSDGDINGSLRKWDFNSEISGRKRYPIHNKFKKTANESKSNVATEFEPLSSGTKFKTRITYHNLKPQELGALFSAITFHKRESHFHNLGMAKSYGFGKIKVEIIDAENVEDFLKKFEAEMDSFLSKKKESSSWINTTEIQELMVMAKENQFQDASKLKYPTLENFAAITKSNKALPKYSNFMNVDAEDSKKYSEDAKGSNGISQVKELEDDLDKEDSTFSEKSEQIKPKNLEINFDDIILNTTEVEFKIASFNFPKKAMIVINGEEIECQFTTPKHFNISNWKEGDIKNGVVIQVNSAQKRITQIKFII